MTAALQTEFCSILVRNKLPKECKFGQYHHMWNISTRLIVLDSTKEKAEQATEVTEEKFIPNTSVLLLLLLLRQFALKAFTSHTCFT